MTTGNSGLINYADAGNTIFTFANTYDHASSRMDFAMRTDNPANRVTVMSALGSGRIGIGTTAPADKLHVSSPTANVIIDGAPDNGGISISATTTSRPMMTYSNASTGVLAQIRALNSKDFQIIPNGGSTIAMTLVASGNVGIGTVNPGDKLHVSSPTANVIFDGLQDGKGLILEAQGTSRPDLKFRNATTGALADILATNTKDLQLSVNNGGTLAMHLAASGNVGINTTGPGTKLHMSSGVFTIDGTSAGANFGVNAPVTISSAVFVGTYVSTQAAGGAGASVTALCQSVTYPAGTTFVKSGGCICTGGVAVTGTTSAPNCVTTGCIANGWTCQEPGGTGGACSAYAVCGREQ